MRKLLLAVTGLLVLTACQKPDARLTVLIGATTIVASGAQPIEDSVIVIAGGKIRSIGMRKDVPVPQNSDRIDLKGRWIVPADGARLVIADPANLLVLKRAPNDIAPASPGDVETRMTAGQWAH